MKLLQEQSAQCLRSELDVFSVPPTQTVIDSSHWVEHSPVSTINNTLHGLFSKIDVLLNDVKVSSASTT